MKNYKVTFYKNNEKIAEQVHRDVTASYDEFRKHIEGFMKIFVREARRADIEQVQ